MRLLDIKICSVFFVAAGLGVNALADEKNGISKAASAEKPVLETSLDSQAWYELHRAWNTTPDTAQLTTFDFDDNSALKRLTKLRSLSLVTFSETDNTRLFLGINDDGLVGLHFSAFPRYGKDRHLSLWSMPYVDKPEKEKEAEFKSEAKIALDPKDK